MTVTRGSMTEPGRPLPRSVRLLRRLSSKDVPEPVCGVTVDYAIGVPAADGSREPALSSLNEDFALNVFDVLDQHEAATRRQVLVDRANFSAKDAVNGHMQGGRLAIHRSASADHQVCVPNEVEAIDRAIGGFGARFAEHLGYARKMNRSIGRNSVAHSERSETAR